MKSAAMAIVPVLLVVLLSIALFAAGNDCNNVLTMSRVDVLRSVSSPGTQRYDRSVTMLKDTPDKAQVTVYADAAARAAKQQFEATAATAKRWLADNSLSPRWLADNSSTLPAEVRAAYKACVDQYDVAQRRIDAVIDAVNSCRFVRANWAYNESDGALYNCESDLNFRDELPLMKLVDADREAGYVVNSLIFFLIGGEAVLVPA